MENFKVARFEFKIVAQDKLYLPEYKGSTLRGGFGQTLKRIVCITRDKECKNCLLKEKCAYSYIFETPPPKDTTRLRKYPFAPHPFVIEPLLEMKREYESNDEIAFNLVLIGEAISYLPYFVFVFVVLLIHKYYLADEDLLVKPVCLREYVHIYDKNYLLE